jgi:CRISPR-associated protein Csh2
MTTDSKNFINRVYGCAIVRVIDSNYNADFSGQPRSLNDGTIYATDKTFKYAVKNYFKQNTSETVFAMKSLKDDLRPRSLNERFIKLFDKFPTKTEIKKGKGNEKDEEVEVISREGLASKLLSCIDIKLFGVTYAGEENISIHGPVQINHARNIWKENKTYTEQIMSPYRNSGDEHVNDDATTLGRQSNLEEGHFLHHFSINPANLTEYDKLGGSLDADKEIKLLKQAMRQGVTLYSSSRKAGCDNELLFWVELNEEKNLVLPNFLSLIEAKKEKEDGKIIYDFSKITELLKSYNEDIKKVQLFADWNNVLVENIPEKTKCYELFGEEEKEHKCEGSCKN